MKADKEMCQFEKRTMDKKRYRILNRHGVDVLGGTISGSNPYISTYPIVDSVKLHSLSIGDKLPALYNLCGKEETLYFILRVE